MKRLLLISLAVLLAVSLSITIFPAHSVAALQKGGLAFHISAEGEGEYWFGGWEFEPPPQTWTGEVSINVAGQKGYGYKRTGYSRGYGTPQDIVQGHIKGSFGEHEIDVTLKNPTGYGTLVHLDNGKLDWVTFHLKGTYDGNKVKSAGNRIKVVYDGNGEPEFIFVILANFTSQRICIKIYDASVDLHENPN